MRGPFSIEYIFSIYSKMVVLTIVARKNGETVYFDEPIPQVHNMRLVSCSLYNSWHNLKKVGVIAVDRSSVRIASIPQGHYNLAILERELKSIMRELQSGIPLELETNKPNSVLKLINPNHDRYPINISHALADLLGIGTRLGAISYVKKLNIPSYYFIHCDLIDPSNNFLNGKRSDILAKIDIRGLPYDKVTYPSLPQEAFRECSTGQHVHQITLSVKDEDGEMFDFNGLPIEFVLELN